MEVSRYLDATLRVTAALTEAADADVAFERLLPTLCAELDWDAATLWQPDACGARLRNAGTWMPPGRTAALLAADATERTFVRGEGLPGQVWRSRGPVVVEDLWNDPRFLRPEAARGDGLRTAVAFPVLRGDTLLGVCELYSRERRPVPPELLDVLASAGRQIGQFLARLRAESELRELADTLQRSLLPSHLPDIPGVELAARYRAGADGVFVGGDTYDVLPLPDGRWMVLIADVCGTGAEAAAITSLTRHTARASRAHRSRPRRRPRRGQHRAAARADGRPAAVRHRVLPGHRAARHRGARPDQRGRAPAAAAARRRRRGRPRSAPPGRRSASTPAPATGSCGSSCPPARPWCSTPTA